MEQWSCRFCTLKNDLENIICSMCFQDRFQDTQPPKQASAPDLPPDYGAWNPDAPSAPALPDYDAALSFTPPPTYEEMVQPKQVQPNQDEDKMDDWSDDDDDDFGIPTQKVKTADSWDVGNANQEDNWSDVEEQNDDDFEPEEVTLQEIGWQCVKCAGANSKYDTICKICREDRNPMMFCDICKCEVPFLCFEEHQKSHEANGQVSPVSIAFSLIEKLRNYSSMNSCICWDFAKDFLYKYKEFIEAGFDEDPFIIYHWTEEKNFGSILDNNLKVPDGRTVAVINGSAYGVGIYAHTDPHWGRSYGKGATKMIMCLALKGKVAQKHGRERKKEHFDTTEYGKIYVFYHQAQVLPIYNISPDEVKSVIPLTQQILKELTVSMRESLGRFDNHDPYAGLSMEERAKLASLS